MDQNLKKALLAKDREYVWHPFTQMKDYENEDFILIDRAEGVFLYDADGNPYYDTISSWWVTVHGHNNPRINQAIRNQLEKMEHVIFGSFTHQPGIELAEKLVQVTPVGLNKVFYSDNGSTAVEVALKMSFQYWQQVGKPSKTKFVYVKNSYHGDTVGSFSVGGVEMLHKLFRPLLFETFQAPSPFVYEWGRENGHYDYLSRKESSLEWDIAEECVTESLRSLEEIFQQHSDEIAGMVIEPMIQAAGGMVIYPASYLQGVRKLCSEYSVHLIADEVATGFGRTGKMFACEHAGVSPDLMCLSKGLTAGYLPMAATVTTNDIYDAFYDDYDKLKTFFHGHSFTGNPITAAIGIESLAMFEEDRLVDRVGSTSNVLREAVQRFWSFEHVGDIRCLGHIAAIELVKDTKTGERFPFQRRMGREVYKRALQEGLFLPS